MSKRLENFRKLQQHIVIGKLFKKLNKAEITLCEDFIIKHDHLDLNAFAEKCNRWMLDDKEKPKRHPEMWSLVLQSNTKERGIK